MYSKIFSGLLTLLYSLQSLVFTVSRSKHLVIALSMSISVTLVFGSASAHEGHDSAFGEHSSNVVNTTKKIQIDKDGREAIGVKTEAVKTGSLKDVLHATGKVQAADNKKHDINPPVNGVVEKALVREGDPVKAGQTLAVIHSVEIANVISALLEERERSNAELTRIETKFKRDIEIKQKDQELKEAHLARQKSLLDEGITAQKSYIEAKTAKETADVQLKSLNQQFQEEKKNIERKIAIATSAAKRKLKIMGLSDGAINKAISSNEIATTIPISAPVSGIITQRSVSPGETVSPGENIYTIVGLSPIWVAVDVFQEQISKIKIGQPVRIKTSSGHTTSGTISNIGSVVDPSQRTIHVRIEVANKEGILKPEMFATAEIVTGSSSTKNVVIPASALMEDGGHQFVYVEYNNYFQPVDVKVGDRTSEKVEILDGLFEGDKVVVHGASQLMAHTKLNQGAEQTDKQDTSGAENHSLSHSHKHTHKSMFGKTTEHSHQHEHSHAHNPLQDQSLLLGILIGISVPIAGLVFWLLKKRKPVSKTETAQS